MRYHLKQVTFEDILPVWQNELWPGRESPIRSMSSMTFDKQYDMTIYEKYTPYFWAVYFGDNIVAVNSGHQTSATEFRSRGLYASPDHRGKGLARMVLQATVACAKEHELACVWTVPRKGSEHAYLKTGFELIGDWFDEGMEFGPNIMAVRKLSSCNCRSAI